ncbi:MAG: DUF3592 domain-containing protein [Nanoarchaeota archaeon]|nr:DUF3592 domain-containing protein [Nanoarchaeota archaeon]
MIPVNVKTVLAIFFVIGSLLVSVSGYFFYSFQSVEKLRTEGTIVSVDIAYDSDGDRYERPAISYMTQEGEVRTFVPHVKESLATYSVGQKIQVLYDQKGNAWVDSLVQLYFPYAVPFFIGVVFLIVSSAVFLSIKPQDKGLKDTGKRLVTQYVRREEVPEIQVNGRPQYRILTKGTDAAGNEVFFHSEAMDLPPDEFPREFIDIYVDRKNPSRYYMDLSFLEVKK